MFVLAGQPIFPIVLAKPPPFDGKAGAQRIPRSAST